jgi:hypothetical protein
MIDGSSIREHMEVVGSDGKHVGRVDHIKGQEIELAKFDFGAGLAHHLIPLTWVDHIEKDRVFLNLTQDQAKAKWTKEQH